MAITLIDSKFNWNGWSGMSWIGGQDVSAYWCDFDWNAMGRIGSKNADGLDIEWQGGNGPIKHGLWQRCKFRFNGAYAIECQAGYNGTLHLCDDFEFKGCTFVSSESNYTMQPNAKNFKFNNLCYIHGNITHLYDDQGCFNCPDDGRILFDHVEFYEEYPITGTLIERRSHNLNLLNEWPTGCNTARPHSYVIETDIRVPASRSEFVNCNMYTNYIANWGLFYGRDSQQGNLKYNYMRFNNFKFYNYGINACNCDVHNGAVFDYVDFQTTTPLHFHVPGLVNPPFIGCGTIHYDFALYAYAGIPPTWLKDQNHYYAVPKFTNYHDVTPEILFDNCAACATIYPSNCPGSPSPLCLEPPCVEAERHGISSNPLLNKPQIFPNPTLNTLSVSDIKSGDEIIIFNSVGKQVLKTISSGSLSNISINNLVSGVYFLSINGLITEKFVKVYQE